MTTEVIRIILADDHKLVRDSWKMLLENNPAIRILACCENNEEAVTYTLEHKPDMVLVDINMASPQTGISIAENLIRSTSAKIVGLSVSNHPKYAIRMLEIGGAGYLTKTSTLEEVYRGINEIHNGTTFISSEVLARMTDAEKERLSVK